MNEQRRHAESTSRFGSLTDRQVQILSRVLDGSVSPDRTACSINATKYRITDGIVRFREDSGYSGSFAKQWRQFQLNQYDRHNGTVGNGVKRAMPESW